MRFQDQVAIVTGGATGIGGATARRLAKDGAKVLIADLDAQEAISNVGVIREAGGTAESIRTDVSRHEDIKAMVVEATTRWGRLDILVNNAFGGGERFKGDAVNVPEEAWDQGMSMLVKAIYLGAKYAVPEMRKSGGGSIVNMSSVHGLLMATGWMVYEAGKSAVIGLTRQLACDFGPDGVRVNAICPGHIVTERTRDEWDGNPNAQPLIVNQYPVRRVGAPDDIANAVAFLCSDEASFITGHPLVVDGGLSIQLQENLGVRQAALAKSMPDLEVPGAEHA